MRETLQDAAALAWRNMLQAAADAAAEPNRDGLAFYLGKMLDRSRRCWPPHKTQSDEYAYGAALRLAESFVRGDRHRRTLLSGALAALVDACNRLNDPPPLPAENVIEAADRWRDRADLK